MTRHPSALIPMKSAALITICALLLGSNSGRAQETFLLWADRPAPFSKPHALVEYEAPCWFEACAYNVHEPTLTVYPAKGDSQTAVLILPGGGYDVVAIHHEGHDIARAFQNEGITTAVLKYRLPRPETSTHPEKVPITDTRRALSLLHEHQHELGITAQRIGVMGFSAGAHLATVASVHHSERPEENPDFAMLVYGVTRLTPENLQWLEASLYHRPLEPDEVIAETLLDRVDATVAPAFLVHAYDDETCHYSESTEYAAALTAAGVEAELHLYARGGHGFSTGRATDGTDQWIHLGAEWLKRNEPRLTTVAEPGTPGHQHHTE